jgi:peptide/nickel transport system permease protein
VQSALFWFLARRIVRAALLVLAVSSAALLLVHLAPGDAFSSIDLDPGVAAAERARLGLDRPFLDQYGAWLRRVAVMDFGESTRFRRPVTTLLAERVTNTLLLGSAALLIAVGLGVPAGVLTGSAPRRWWARLVEAVSLLLVATPPLVTALALLLMAARTGWLPAGGFDVGTASGVLDAAVSTLRYLPLPALALALPLAASLERLQSRAIADALTEPCVAAARARGVSQRRATWTHAFRLSLKPVTGVLGIVIGTILSGSFIVEIVMSWPGLGDLMYQALIARDVYLAAGCAAFGGVFLATGVVAADLALMIVDPRTVERA